jgi:hypothetical protein
VAPRVRALRPSHFRSVVDQYITFHVSVIRPARGLQVQRSISVSKLPRNGVLSAAHHLRAIIGEHSVGHPDDPLVPVHITPGDE